MVSLAYNGKGREMRDMASVYFNMRTADLKRLKGEKQMRLLKLRKQVMTYSVQQEIRKLEFQLNRIDAVLNSRFNQGLLFP